MLNSPATGQRILFCLWAILLVSTSSSWSQVLVEDITHKLNAYDYSQDIFLPHQQGPVCQIDLPLSKYEGLYLLVSGPVGCQVFFGTALHTHISSAGTWQVSINELSRISSNNTLNLTLVAANSNSEVRWKAEIIDPTKSPNIPPSQLVTKTTITTPYQHNILVALWFLLSTLIVFGYSQLTRFFLDYFSFTSIFSAIQREEAAFKASILEQNNFFFVVMYCLCASALGLLLTLEQPQLATSYFIIGDGAGNWALLNWFLWAFILLILLGLKGILLSIVSTPFSLHSSRKLQLFNYIRASVVVATPLSILLISAKLIWPTANLIYPTLAICLSSLFLFRIILLYLKLRRASTLRNVHLISYLCATEIAPAAVFLKLFYSI